MKKSILDTWDAKARKKLGSRRKLIHTVKVKKGVPQKKKLIVVRSLYDAGRFIRPFFGRNIKYVASIHSLRDQLEPDVECVVWTNPDASDFNVMLSLAIDGKMEFKSTGGYISQVINTPVFIIVADSDKCKMQALHFERELPANVSKIVSFH